MDLLSELLGDVLLGHLLGPLQDDLLLQHILLEELLENVGHLRKEHSLEGLDSFLNPSDQILLTFGVLVGEPKQ